jgi:glycosyltransferase involved in cell wall biosynthesis
VRISVFVKGTIFHPTHGGLEIQNQVLCEGLLSSGYDVTIFTPQKDYNGNLDLIHNGIRYIFVPCIYKMGRFFGFFGFSDKQNWVNRSYEEFVKLDKEKHFEVVISQSTAGVGVIKRKEQHLFKSIMVAHGSIISEYRTYLLELRSFSLKKLVKLVPNTGYALKNFFTRQRECVLGADKVVAVSSFVKQVLLDETYAPEEKFVVINNGIQSNDLSVVQKTVNKTMLFSGRLEYSKGVVPLLHVFGSLVINHPDAQLIVAGDGPMKKDMELLAQDLGIKDNVEFLGWVSKDQIVKASARSSILVLPTLRIEGFPMSIIEAMAEGLVVVASDIGGSKDAIINGSTGYLVKPGDKVGLLQILTELITNDEKLKQMMIASRQHFETNFTSKTMVQKYLKVIKEL